MADHQERGTVTNTNVRQQGNNFRLQRGVKFAGGLVRNHQRWLARYRLCDDDSLPLPPTKLMRVSRIYCLGMIEPNRMQQFLDTSPAFAVVHRQMGPEHLCDLITDPDHWIEREGGVLRNQRNILSANGRRNRST